MIRTPLCELAGIRYPIFQGGMAHISDGKLAAAVSEAGGLGIISASGGPDHLRKQISIARSLTDKPIGVNLMLMSPDAPDAARVIAEEKIEVVTTGAGNPAEFMPLWLDAGCRVIPVVASAALAKMMERCGACAVIAEGGESGGHIGEAATMPLVPQVIDAVSLPVIAAGGIADGRGLAAALMLGAVGVQIGTRFLAAHECSIHPHYKSLVLKATDTSTIVTGRRLGHPVRSIKTPYSRKYAKTEVTDISDSDLEALGIGSLRKAVEGNETEGCYLAGQIAGLVKKEQSAEEMILEICTEAEEILKTAARYVI